MSKLLGDTPEVIQVDQSVTILHLTHPCDHPYRKQCQNLTKSSYILQFIATLSLIKRKYFVQSC